MIFVPGILCNALIISCFFHHNLNAFWLRKLMQLVGPLN